MYKLYIPNEKLPFSPPLLPFPLLLSYLFFLLFHLLYSLDLGTFSISNSNLFCKKKGRDIFFKNKAGTKVSNFVNLSRPKHINLAQDPSKPPLSKKQAKKAAKAAAAAPPAALPADVREHT